MHVLLWKPIWSLRLGYEFGAPMLFSGVFPYAHVRPNSLNQITPLKDTATNKILSLKEIFDKRLI